MAKGIARLGFLFTSVLVTASAGAAKVGDLSTSAIGFDPPTGDARGEWFELNLPAIDKIDPRAIIIGDDGKERQRIETDLLDLPGHFLTLACNGERAPDGRFRADCIYDNFTPGASVLHATPVERPCHECRTDFDLSGRTREFTGAPKFTPNHGLALATRASGPGGFGNCGAPPGTGIEPSISLPAAPRQCISTRIAAGDVQPGRIAAEAGIGPSCPELVSGFLNPPRSDGVAS